MRISTIHVAGLSVLVGLAGCGRKVPADNLTNENAVNISRPADPAAVSRPEPPLGRRELLAAAHSAASAYSAGRSLPDEATDLAGREFVIALPLACPGAELGERQAGLTWSYDAQEERLRLRAEPNIGLETSPVTVAAGEHEAVEGFWIPRPWTDSEDCPPRQDATASPGTQPPPSAPSIGLAQFFTAADSRTRQRAGRPYETVERIEAEQLSSEQGFRLVIAGRVAAAGGTIVCHSLRPDIRPSCLIAVEIDRVSFLIPNTGTTLASWEPR